LEATPRRGAARAAAPAGLAWRLLDRADPTAGRCTVCDVVVRDVREAMILADPPRTITFENVLGVNLQSLTALRRVSALAEIGLTNVTLRGTACVVAVGAGGKGTAIRVSAEDSIFDLAPGGSLFAMLGAADGLRLQWEGAGSVTTSDVPPMA